jgi:hypothetical protein
VKDCLQKILDDTKCDPEVGLCWAIAAKNSLFNNNGFSPDQLTYGRNNNYPSVLIDEPPALESSSTVDVIRENMTALHKAREAFIQSESSERIRKALRHNIRTYANEVYENGDKVFYRRKNYKGWKGPGTVIGRDGQTVLIKHGSTYCRVHPCQMMKKKASTMMASVPEKVPHHGPEGKDDSQLKDISVDDDDDEEGYYEEFDGDHTIPRNENNSSTQSSSEHEDDSRLQDDQLNDDNEVNVEDNAAEPDYQIEEEIADRNQNSLFDESINGGEPVNTDISNATSGTRCNNLSKGEPIIDTVTSVEELNLKQNVLM